MGRELVKVELRWRNTSVLDFTTQADPKDPDDLQALFEQAMARYGRDLDKIHEYSIRLREHRGGSHIIDYVARSG